MTLSFSTCFSLGYLKALYLCKQGQPEKWEFFCSEVPTFSACLYGRRLFLSGAITHFRYKNEMRNSKSFYSACWEKHQNTILHRLTKLFGYELDDKPYTAHICITPLYIRNITKRYFLVPTNASEERIMEILIHELSHFYFYHHKNAYYYDPTEFWKLSELIVPIMIRTNFTDICLSSDSYAGEPSENWKCRIHKWATGEQSFDSLLDCLPRSNNHE